MSPRGVTNVMTSEDVERSNARSSTHLSGDPTSPSEQADPGADYVPQPLQYIAPTLDSVPTALVDSLRYIIGRCELTDETALPPCIAVVSAMHGEGVTTVSRALAATLARDHDSPVCWVDLSWAASVATSHDDETPGLFEVLQQREELDDVLQATDDGRLMLLGPGALPREMRHVVARSAQLADLIAELSYSFTYVVLDVPPILASSEGLAMLRYAHAHLLVVRHGVTTIKQVRAATAELEVIPMVGVVLNQFKTRIPKRLRSLLAP